jgi:hypothetical protein
MSSQNQIQKGNPFPFCNKFTVSNKDKMIDSIINSNIKKDDEMKDDEMEEVVL